MNNWFVEKIEKRLKELWEKLPNADTPQDTWTDEELTYLGAYKELESLLDEYKDLPEAPLCLNNDGEPVHEIATQGTTSRNYLSFEQRRRLRRVSTWCSDTEKELETNVYVEDDKYFSNHPYFKYVWKEQCEGTKYLQEAAVHFYELGRRSVIQDVHDGKYKIADKITAAWLNDGE